MGLDVIFFAILAELIIIELLAVVHNKGMWYPEPRGNVLVYEGLHIPLSNGGQGFSLSPFREVVYGDYYIPALSLSRWRKGDKQVETPLGKRPRTG